MPRIDVKQQSCPVADICMIPGDHSHETCSECGAADYTGNCQTCRTLYPVKFPGIARSWQEPS